MPASLKLPVHVSCTDAQTQTDETCITELKSATSNAGSKLTLAPPLSGMAQIKMGVVPSTSTQPGERGGSVVECRTPEREVRGSRPTAAVLCP